MEIHVATQPVTVFFIGSFGVTNTLLTSWISCILLIVRFPAPEWPVAAATLAILAAIVAGRRIGAPAAAALEPVATAGVVLTAYTLLALRWPAFWIALEGATRDLTARLGRLGGAGTSLGPSVAGVPLLVLVLAYLAARRLKRR